MVVVDRKEVTSRLSLCGCGTDPLSLHVRCRSGIAPLCSDFAARWNSSARYAEHYV